MIQPSNNAVATILALAIRIARESASATAREKALEIAECAATMLLGSPTEPEAKKDNFFFVTANGNRRQYRVFRSLSDASLQELCKRLLDRQVDVPAVQRWLATQMNDPLCKSSLYRLQKELLAHHGLALTAGAAR